MFKADCKPCPNCGTAPPGTLATDQGGMAGSTTWRVAVHCGKCGMRGPYFVDGAYQPDGQSQRAVEAWNNLPRRS